MTTAGPPLRCAVCARPRDQVRQLIVGPDIYLCDGCVETANAALSASVDASGPACQTCSFCEKEVSGPFWSVGPVGVCGACLELFNQVLYDSLGPEALNREARERVARAREKAQREERRLEMALISRRASSLKQELMTVNLDLIVRNVRELLSLLGTREGAQFVKRIPPARRRGAVTALANLAEALRTACAPARAGRSVRGPATPEQRRKRR